MATSGVYQSIQQSLYRYALLLPTIRSIDRVLGSVFKRKSEVSVFFTMYVELECIIYLS